MRALNLCTEAIMLDADFCAFISGRKIRLPGNRDRREQRPVRHMMLLREEAQYLVLARPFGRQIAKTDDAHSVRQSTFNSGSDEVGGKEGERDHHVDLSYAAAFSRRYSFGICRRIRDKFIEPAAPSRNRCDQCRAGFGADGTSVFSFGRRGIWQKDLAPPL
jgi:hypothetical protein